jgi:type IV pilus assembly protein PilX
MRLVDNNSTRKRSADRGYVAQARQKGAVMIVALMLLLVMTVLAISGVGNSVLEQKMSGNYYQATSAFEAAEYGVRVAEQWLIKQVVASSAWETWFAKSVSLNGLYTTQELSSPNNVEVCSGDIDCVFDPRDVDEWCMGGAGCNLPKGFVTLGDTLEGTTLATLDMPVDRQPQFIIEYIGPISTSSIQLGAPELPASQSGFRVTVIGWGQNSAARHVIQTHVILPL